MNLFRFIPVEQILHSPHLGSYCSFGIRTDERTAKGWKGIALFSDVSVDSDFVTHTAALCSTLQLSPLHFLDVLFDSIP